MRHYSVGSGEIVRVRFCVFVFAGLALSVTFIVKVKLPLAVGVPHISPVAAFSVFAVYGGYGYGNTLSVPTLVTEVSPSYHSHCELFVADLYFHYYLCLIK
jgi:hypothetical protein